MELWSCGAVELRSCGAVELWSCGAVEATPVHRGHVRCTGGAPQNGAQGAPKNPVHRGRFTRDLIAGRPLCTVLTRPLCTVFGAPPVHRIEGAPCAPY